MGGAFICLFVFILVVVVVLVDVRCYFLQTEVKNTLQMICETLPGSLASNCNAMVKYFDLGWAILKQEIVSQYYTPQFSLKKGEGDDLK